MRQIQLGTFLLLLTVMVGCGFHLRGSFNLPLHLQSLYITPDDPYDKLQRGLRRALLQKNIQLVTTATDNIAILTLTTPTFAESILAFNAYGQPQRFKLAASFQYQVSYANKSLQPLTTIQVSRDFTLQPNQLLSSDNERNLIKDELVQEAINALLQQLSAIPAPHYTLNTSKYSKAQTKMSRGAYMLICEQRIESATQLHFEG